MTCLLVDLSEPLFEFVDIHDPGMRIRETTRNKGFRTISNWFFIFAHSWIKNTSIEVICEVFDEIVRVENSMVEPFWMGCQKRS